MKVIIRPKRRTVLAMVLLAAALAAILAPSALAAPGTTNTAGWSFLKNEGFASELDEAGYEPMKGMLTTGGTLLIPVTDKVSVGFGGATAFGWSTSEDRNASLELGYGGIAVEYGGNVGERMNMGIGAVLGLGTATLATKQGAITGFEDLLDAANSATAWRPYLVVQPMASIGFAASPFVNVSISGGYTFMWSPIGWIDGFAFRDHFEGPLKTIGMPFIQLGIAFGATGVPVVPED